MPAIDEPYTGMFEAIEVAISAAGGPFTKAGQLKYWGPDGIDDAMPTDELISALTPVGTGPVCLLSYDGSSPGKDPGDGLWAEEIMVLIRYGIRNPQHSNFEKAYKADGQDPGDVYWGEFAVRKWLFTQLIDNNVVAADVQHGLFFIGISPIAVRQQSVLAYSLRMTTDIVHQPGVN